jgi:hypothetical protein
MNLGAGAHSLSLWIVHCALWLVPAGKREEWVAEWEAELWHAAHAGDGSSFRDARALIRFSLGAFHDAFWIRRNHRVAVPRRMFRPGSASRCSISLAAWALASVMLCWFLPGANNAMHRVFRNDRDGLVMITRGGFAGAQSPSISFEEYRSWKTDARHLFSDFAFYAPVPERVHVSSRHGVDRDVELSIGQSSENLFSLLRLPAAAGTSTSHLARLLLTSAAWKENFAGDPRVVGSLVQINGQRVLIAGIADRNATELPGKVDAWLLEDEAQIAALPATSTGFVLAQLRGAGALHHPQRWQSMIVHHEQGSERFDCIPLSEQDRFPSSIFLFTLIVALLALPATTPLPLGEYPHHTGRLPWAGRARRWVFLWSKIALLVPLVHFTAMDAAYGHALHEVTAQYIQLTISFFGFLLGFRWILQDQRRRCPVCLRVLSNPARVGEASRNFLAWNGTELICAGGHGLLHIPEHPTSWFGTQRWLDLDASWGTLFADGYVPYPELV